MTSVLRKIWPLALKDTTRWSFLMDELAPVMRCLNADDAPWGLEMILFRNGVTTVATNRISWLNAGSSFPTRIQSKHLTHEQMLAILELSGNMGVPQSICEDMPIQLDGSPEGPRWITLTLTARAVILSLANLRRYLNNSKTAARIDALFALPAEEMISAYPDLDPIFQQAVTVLHPGMDALSGHQKLRYMQDLKGDIESHLARFSMMLPAGKKIGLRPDWQVPDTQVAS